MLYACTDEDRFGLDRLMHTLGQAVAVGDRDMRFVAANLAFAQFYGMECPSQLIGRTALEVYPDFQKSVFYEAANLALLTQSEHSRVGYSANVKAWFVARCYPLGPDHAAMIVHRVTSDLSKTGYVNEIDTLTSLPNRFAFERTYESFRSYQNTMTVSLIDISHFKKFNETAGFHAGDQVLTEMGTRLKMAVAHGDGVYRVGNDQFLILSIHGGPGHDLLLHNIHEKLVEPFNVNGKDYVFRFHVGSSATDMSTSSTEALRQAEVAMFQSKNGRGTIIHYQKDMDTTDYDQSLVKDINDAIQNEHLTIVFQPQIDLLDNKVVGAEVLVRWNHPSGQLRPPMSFLPFAEETGLIEEIDKEVVRQSFAAINELKSQGMGIPLSINLSAHSVCQEKTLEVFDSNFKRFGVDPSLIHAEITETSLIRDIETSQRVTQGLRAMGVQISIDDFGSGYSSMSYLLRYPSHFLKIDGQFIRQITTSDAHRVMVQNMIGLAHGLKIMVVAEGVETQQERDLLKDMGCDIVQGYFYAKPMPMDEFVSFVRNQGVGCLVPSMF